MTGKKGEGKVNFETLRDFTPRCSGPPDDVNVRRRIVDTVQYTQHVTWATTVGCAGKILWFLTPTLCGFTGSDLSRGLESEWSYQKASKEYDKNSGRYG